MKKMISIVLVVTLLIGANSTFVKASHKEKEDFFMTCFATVITLGAVLSIFNVVVIDSLNKKSKELREKNLDDEYDVLSIKNENLRRKHRELVNKKIERSGIHTDYNILKDLINYAVDINFCPTEEEGDCAPLLEDVLNFEKWKNSL